MFSLLSPILSIVENEVLSDLKAFPNLIILNIIKLQKRIGGIFEVNYCLGDYGHIYDGIVESIIYGKEKIVKDQETIRQIEILEEGINKIEDYEELFA
jgi:hypothetical protein